MKIDLIKLDFTEKDLIKMDLTEKDESGYNSNKELACKKNLNKQ